LPIYEYRCPKGHTFELFQRMSDEPVAACPECGESASRVLSGGAGFLFKGEGFYITDYRSEDYKKKAKAEAGGGSEKKSEGGGPEKKPEGSASKTPGEGGPAGSGGSSSGSDG